MSKIKEVGGIKVIGVLNWIQLRQFIIDELDKCRTEHEFEVTIEKLWKSVGTKEHIIRTRKLLGLKPLTDEELEKMK